MTAAQENGIMHKYKDMLYLTIVPVRRNACNMSDRDAMTYDLNRDPNIQMDFDAINILKYQKN